MSFWKVLHFKNKTLLNNNRKYETHLFHLQTSCVFTLCSLNSLFFYFGVVYSHFSFIFTYVCHVSYLQRCRKCCQLNIGFSACFPSDFTLFWFLIIIIFSVFPKHFTCSSFLSQFVSSDRLFILIILNLTITYIVWSSVPCTCGGGCGINIWWVNTYHYILSHCYAYLHSVLHSVLTELPYLIR